MSQHGQAKTDRLLEQIEEYEHGFSEQSPIPSDDIVESDFMRSHHLRDSS